MLTATSSGNDIKLMCDTIDQLSKVLSIVGSKYLTLLESDHKRLETGQKRHSYVFTSKVRLHSQS